mmetsp:Transcript_94279/g.264028  ORF Transcript_94279/g.264028 Transcript_94279/m.264028 type:complete len:415 (+) Transcript_94279:2-1246(+)
MPVRRADSPTESGCCADGLLAALFGRHGPPRSATVRKLPMRGGSGSGLSGLEAVSDLHTQVRDSILYELRTLREQLSSELSGVIERLNKAEASEKEKREHDDHPCAFKVGRHLDDDVVDASPRIHRRPTGKRRFTASADGKDSLADLLKNSMLPTASSAEDTIENSSNESFKAVVSQEADIEPDRSVSRESASSFRGKTSFSEGRKNLHARIEERLNEVHQHQVEEEHGDVRRDERQEPMEDTRSDISTPSCSSTIWRLDALDWGDRLAANAAAKKGTASVESIVELVETERDRWATEKQGLEARLEEVKEQLQTFETPSDTEKNALKRQVAELRQTIKVRSRFGAWVCERHMQESDDEEEDDELRNADKEALRIQLQQVETELREARRTVAAAPVAIGTSSSRGGRRPVFVER